MLRPACLAIRRRLIISSRFRSGGLIRTSIRVAFEILDLIWPLDTIFKFEREVQSLVRAVPLHWATPTYGVGGRIRTCTVRPRATDL